MKSRLSYPVAGIGCVGLAPVGAIPKRATGPGRSGGDRERAEAIGEADAGTGLRVEDEVEAVPEGRRGRAAEAVAETGP